MPFSSCVEQKTQATAELSINSIFSLKKKKERERRRYTHASSPEKSGKKRAVEKLAHETKKWRIYLVYRCFASSLIS